MGFHNNNYPITKADILLPNNRAIKVAFNNYQAINHCPTTKTKLDIHIHNYQAIMGKPRHNRIHKVVFNHYLTTTKIKIKEDIHIHNYPVIKVIKVDFNNNLTTKEDIYSHPTIKAYSHNKISNNRLHYQKTRESNHSNHYQVISFHHNHQIIN